MKHNIKESLKQKGYEPLFHAIDRSRVDLKRLGYTQEEVEDALLDIFGDTDPKIVKRIKKETIQ